MEKDRKFFVDNLEIRLLQCIGLMENKKEAKDIVSRLVSDLDDVLAKSNDGKYVQKEFSHFVSKVLSVVEAMDLPEMQYTAIRRLMLKEIYDCENEYLRSLQKEIIKENAS